MISWKFKHHVPYMSSILMNSLRTKFFIYFLTRRRFTSYLTFFLFTHEIYLLSHIRHVTLSEFNCGCWFNTSTITSRNCFSNDPFPTMVHALCSISTTDSFNRYKKMLFVKMLENHWMVPHNILSFWKGALGKLVSIWNA